MDTQKRILIVANDSSTLHSLEYVACMKDVFCIGVDSVEEACECLKQVMFSVTLIDLDLPGNGAYKLIEYIHDCEILTVSVLLSAHLDEEIADKAFERGVFDCLALPASGLDLKLLLERAARHYAKMNKIEQIANQLRIWDAVFNYSPDVIVMMDGDFKITRYNAETVKQLGDKKMKLIGSKCWDVFGEKVLPPGEDSSEERFRLLLSGRHEAQLDCFGGYYEISLAPIQLNIGNEMNFVMVAHDITELKILEKRRRLKYDFLQLVLDSVPNPIYYKNKEGRYEIVNKAFEEILDISKDQILGRTVHELDWSPPEAAEIYDRDSELLERGGNELFESSVPRPDGDVRQVILNKAVVNGLDGQTRGIVGVMIDLTERKREEALRSQLAGALEQSTDGIVITGEDNLIIYANHSMEEMKGYSREEMIGKHPDMFRSEITDDKAWENMQNVIVKGESWKGRVMSRRKNGENYPEEITISPVRNSHGDVVNHVVIARDISHETEMENQLRLAQKLESIGQLAAGIAHEINTPIQYIGDNAQFLKDSFQTLMEVLEECKNMKCGEVSDYEAVMAKLAACFENEDLDFLSEEIPGAIDSIMNGVERVSKIVRSMKQFSHPGAEEKTMHNLNEAIESTVTVARNEWKYVADVEMDFDLELPSVPCYPGEINQTILNIVVNAAHSIGSKIDVEKGEKGMIRIETRQRGDYAEIRISDTGGGIPEEIHSKIFDPFFTTKGVGVGTGQGLAISRSAIAEKHGGMLFFETELGVGTTFVIQLPFKSAESRENNTIL